MEISAQHVKELRERTGAGMMECKKALTEAKGDMEEAITILRKRGLASAAKKAGRITSEGLVDIQISPVNGKSAGAIVELNCETDFVARTEEFKALVAQLASHILVRKPSSVEEMLSQRFDPGDAKTIREELTDRMARIGENLSLRRFERFELDGTGVLGKYIHAGGKIGVLVDLGVAGVETQREELQHLVHDVAMHVAASDPRFLGRKDVPADVLENEKEIARAKVPAGKPPQVIEKIMEGQLTKFYGEVCLLEQPFVKEPGVTVGQWVSQEGSAIGGTVEIRRYVRFKTGEGLEKRGDDFAAEVAAQLK